MGGKGRYVSNLDLKLLGAKFITIPDSHLEISHNLSDIRRSRGGDLPSILNRDSNLTPEDQDIKCPILDRLNPIDFRGSKKSSLCSSVEKEYSRLGKQDYSEKEKQEISKYRSLIRKIKNDNDIIHREITNLYREKKINDNEAKTKAVKTIFKLPKQDKTEAREARVKGTKTSPVTGHYNDIYERLNSLDNPYREESLEIQKKLSNSNLHKNFEAFLQSHNRRVPDFIKQIR